MKTLYRNTSYSYKYILGILALLVSFTVSAQQENMHFVQALTKFKECNYRGAATDFSKAIDYDKNTGEAFAYRARCAIFMGDLDNAKADLEQAAALIKGKNTQLLLSYGYYYNALKDYKKAIEYLEKAIKADNKLAEAYNALGFSYQSMGDHKQALEHYTSAIKADNKYAIAYNNHGAAIYLNQDIAKASKWDLKNALFDFEKALDLDTGFCTARRNKALVLKLIREDGQALQEINRAINCDPDNVDNYITRGVIMYETKLPEEAIASFNKALEKNPNKAEAYIEMARLKARLKRYDEAYADLEKAEEVNPALKGDIFYTRAVVAAHKGHKDDTIHFLNKAKQNGFFKSKIAISNFKADDDFMMVRSKPDFTKFVNSLR